MIELDEVFAAIREERLYQDHKYGPPDVRGLGLGDYVIIAEAEIDEVRYDIARNQPEHACLELLQVAAVIVAALQRHGVERRR
jgi:hypothetical protein